MADGSFLDTFTVPSWLWKQKQKGMITDVIRDELETQSAKCTSLFSFSRTILHFVFSLSCVQKKCCILTECSITGASWLIFTYQFVQFLFVVSLDLGEPTYTKEKKMFSWERWRKIKSHTAACSRVVHISLKAMSQCTLQSCSPVHLCVVFTLFSVVPEFSRISHTGWNALQTTQPRLNHQWRAGSRWV